MPSRNDPLKGIWSQIGDRLIVSTGNSAAQIDHAPVWIYEIVIETENNASDRTRGKFQRNKPEKIDSTILDITADLDSSNRSDDLLQSVTPL